MFVSKSAKQLTAYKLWFSRYIPVWLFCAWLLQRMHSFSKYKGLHLTVCYRMSSICIKMSLHIHGVYTHISGHCVVMNLIKTRILGVMSFVAHTILSCVLYCVVMQCFRYRHDVNRAYEFNSVSTVFNVYKLSCLFVYA